MCCTVTQDGAAGMEIVAADAASQGVRIYYASGSIVTACGGFTAIERIAVADFNSDGLMDIAVADGSIGKFSTTFRRTTLLLCNGLRNVSKNVIQCRLQMSSSSAANWQCLVLCVLVSSDNCIREKLLTEFFDRSPFSCMLAYYNNCRVVCVHAANQ
jgi:hypothetical protein